MGNRGAEKHRVRADGTSSSTHHLTAISMCVVTGCYVAAVVKTPAATKWYSHTRIVLPTLTVWPLPFCCRILCDKPPKPRLSREGLANLTITGSARSSSRHNDARMERGELSRRLSHWSLHCPSHTARDTGVCLREIPDNANQELGGREHADPLSWVGSTLGRPECAD